MTGTATPRSPMAHDVSWEPGMSGEHDHAVGWALCRGRSVEVIRSGHRSSSIASSPMAAMRSCADTPSGRSQLAGATNRDRP